MNVSLNCLNGLKAFEIVHQGVPAHDCLAFKGEEDFLKKKKVVKQPQSWEEDLF